MKRLAPLAAALIVAAFVVTLDREPIRWADEILYASTALAVQRDGVGVPTLAAGRGQSINHLAFYGPVFFTTAARTFDVFGFSTRSFRAVSLAGTLLIAVAGMMLTATLGGGRTRQWLTGLALLLTPELGSAATNGRMDGFAVGLEMAGLAVFVLGCVRGRAWWAYGGLSGALLSLAVLSVPRVLPFLAAFALAAPALWLMPGDRRRAAMRQYAAAWAVVLVTVGAWSAATHGSVFGWFAYLAYLGVRTPPDAMVAAGAFREWQITPWGLLTPALVALAIALLAVRTARSGGPSAALRLLGVPLAAAIVNVIFCVLLFNLTFTFATYFIVPLAVLLLALPAAEFGVPRRLVVAVFAVALVAAGAVRAVKYAGVAATWEARDPAAVDRFLAEHVPPGAQVIGPYEVGFYAAEGAGARFTRLEPESWAGWARSAPLTEAPPPGEDDGAQEYLLWPVYAFERIRPEHRCAVASPPIARFQPERSDRNALWPLPALTGEPGYRSMLLFRVPDGCLENR